MAKYKYLTICRYKNDKSEKVVLRLGKIKKYWGFCDEPFLFTVVTPLKVIQLPYMMTKDEIKKYWSDEGKYIWDILKKFQEENKNGNL